ncbi:MAG: hypothetical protein ACPHCI_01160 [Solirubrobacterales bacterium]
MTNSKLSCSALGMACVALSLISLALLASNASASQNVQSHELSSSMPIWKSVVRTGAKPPARARMTTCRRSRFYDGRRVEFSGRMTAFTSTPGAAQTMQIRFDVYRKFNGRKRNRYKRVKGTGLGKWLPASDPAATVYIREITLQGVETYARYKARVRFRWLRADGTVEWQRVRTTKSCHQKIGLPQLVTKGTKRLPVVGSPQENYVVTVFNAGRSEAVNVPVFLSVDDGSPQGTIVSSLAARRSVEVNFNAAPCNVFHKISLDPERTLRLRRTSRSWMPFNCR